MGLGRCDICGQLLHGTTLSDALGRYVEHVAAMHPVEEENEGLWL